MSRDTVSQEALDYLKRKGLKPSFDHRDVWKEEHNNNFTVAKMMQLDMLADTQQVMEQAIAEGWTYKQFQDNLKPMLVKRGWWGIQEMQDSLTEETKLVQLGSEARIKTIYNTNMRTARSAGQWQRIQDRKETHPYLLYELGPSREHRDEHVKWAGTLLPADHPWWQTHYPKNGWGCNCRVRQVNEREAQRLKSTGLRSGEQEIGDNGLPTGKLTNTTIPIKTSAPKVETRQLVNKRTGEVENVPKGIDPGWNYNPGIETAQKLSLYNSKLNAADAQTAKASISESLKGEQFKEWYAAPNGSFPIAVIGKLDQDKLKAKVHTAQLSQETAIKQHREHPEVLAVEYGFVQQTIDQGEVIQDTANTLIYIHEQAGYVSVVKATKSGQGLFLSSFRRLSSDEAKRDRELTRLRKKGKR